MENIMNERNTPPNVEEKESSQKPVCPKCPKCPKGCTLHFPIAGITIAVCMSWIFNHSVLWAIFHGILNWFYVAYKTIWYVVKHY